MLSKLLRASFSVYRMNFPAIAAFSQAMEKWKAKWANRFDETLKPIILQDKIVLTKNIIDSEVKLEVSYQYVLRNSFWNI